MKMPWCPNCGGEYRDGFYTCVDCGAKLVERQPIEESPAPAFSNDHLDLMLLSEMDTQIEADMLCALLESNGIYVLRRPKGAGAYLRAYMGHTIYGEQLYVRSSDYDRAGELVEGFYAKSEYIESVDEEYPPDAGEESGEVVVSFATRRRVIKKIVLVFFMLNFASSLIAGLIIWISRLGN